MNNRLVPAILLPVGAIGLAGCTTVSIQGDIKGPGGWEASGAINIGGSGSGSASGSVNGQGKTLSIDDTDTVEAEMSGLYGISSFSDSYSGGGYSGGQSYGGGYC